MKERMQHGYTEKFTGEEWHIEEGSGTFGVFAGEALLAMVLPDEVADKSAQSANAHLESAALLLLRVCKQAAEILGNSLLGHPGGIQDRCKRAEKVACRCNLQGSRISQTTI